MNGDRRSILQASAGLVVAGLAGCLGGGSGDSDDANNSSNESGNRSTVAGSTEADTTTGATITEKADTTTGATTTESQDALGRYLEFDGAEMEVPLSSQVEIDEVRMNTPSGEQFGKYVPGQYESKAPFTLIRESTERFGYEPYPYGEWEAVALRNGETVDTQRYQLDPQFSLTSVDGSQGLVDLTFKNIGTAPAAVTGARIYKPNLSPDPDQFGGGFVKQNAITAPEREIVVETRLMGYGKQYPVKENESASDYEGEYCTGEVRRVTVDHRVFSEIKSTTGTLAFGGRPVDGPNSSAVCTEYTINAGGTITETPTGNATGTATGNATGTATGNATETNQSANTSSASRSATTGNDTTRSGATTSNSTNSS